MRFIALAALLLKPKELRPTVVAIDEPELGLHQFAIAALASILRVASRETRIVVATKLPVLLDHFEPEEVLVADRHDGQTGITRMEAGKLSAWLEDYCLGQLWQENELGGPACARKLHAMRNWRRCSQRWRVSSMMHWHIITMVSDQSLKNRCPRQFQVVHSRVPTC